MLIASYVTKLHYHTYTNECTNAFRGTPALLVLFVCIIIKISHYYINWDSNLYSVCRANRQCSDIDQKCFTETISNNTANVNRVCQLNCCGQYCLLCTSVYASAEESINAKQCIFYPCTHVNMQHNDDNVYRADRISVIRYSVLLHISVILHTYSIETQYAFGADVVKHWPF